MAPYQSSLSILGYTVSLNNICIVNRVLSIRGTDMQTGEIIDLNHSYGPPGYDIPMLGSVVKDSTQDVIDVANA